MRCIECDRPAVALCTACLVGQCETHLTRSRQTRGRTGALTGCSHPDRPAGEVAAESE